jgi:hypothetical protein
MDTPSPKEIARQYRVAKQTLAMHADLRDTYTRIGLTVELVLLVFSALIARTTFAGDEFFGFLHVTPAKGRFAFGVVASLSFACSLVMLLLNPRGRAATHAESASRWSDVVLRFRRCRGEDDTWPAEVTSELAEAYAQVNKITASIPEAKFNRLKSRYLRKVEVSRLKDRYPGCPRIILAVLCRLRDTWRAVRGFAGGAPAQAETPPEAAAD